MTPMSARIAIAGGGPTGLMMGRLLAADGHHVDVFEADSVIGGLCRTRQVDGYEFDVAGGHIMFTKDPRVDAFWTELFADDPCHEIRRDTRILHDPDHWVSYPFENGLGDLPLEANLECTEGVIRASLARATGAPEPEDFQGWIDWKMGTGVAKHFMVPYNEKIWKANLAEMGTTWIAGRVPDAPVEDILRASLGENTEGYTHQINFRYPMRGGFAAIHERIADPIRDRIRLRHRVEQIERVGDRWVVDGEHYDQVISTIPLHVLPRVLKGMDPGAADAASRLQYRGVTTYLFGMEQEWVKPYCWVYLPHRAQGPVNRLTYLSNYSPNNTPDGKGSILAEVTYAGDSPDIGAAGQREVAEALARSRLLDADRLTVSDGASNPVAYILYDLDFESKRNTILAHLDGLEGFHALGRFGRYEYHNSDQCLARCFELHDRLSPLLEAGGGSTVAGG
jgi:protoporphyrinogen oxidase